MCHAKTILNSQLKDLKSEQENRINTLNERYRCTKDLEDELAKVTNKIADVEHALSHLSVIPMQPTTLAEGILNG